MNKKFLKHYMETEPEGTSKKYIFLVDNQDIAMNIVMSGYQALYLGQEDDGYYFSVNSFIEDMRSIQFHGTCQSAYHYVAACTTKWMNDRILEFCKEAGLDGKAGWQLFKEKEYLGKLDNQPEVGKALEQFILRFEREPKNDPELSRFHKFDSKGKITGVRDMEIVDYIVENVSFFVKGEIPYYYEHGVFIEDTKGVKLKYRIQKLIYRDQVNSSTIQRVYNLLITQPQIYRNSYELNKQPAHWINFKNAYYDVLSGELIEHDPKYLTINQIPFPYYPEDREKVLEGGANIRKYLNSSIADKVEQQMFWEYFGYCMTTDTQFQKFLMLKGNGGTGKSVAVALIQHVIGNENTSSISLQDFYERGELIESEHSKECVRELRRLSDSVCAFLEDKLVKEKGKRLKRSDVFRMYEEYCEDNGRQGHAKSGFFKNMEGKGFQARKYNGDYCYQDIAIREEDFQPLEAGEKTPFDEHSEQLKLNI